MKPLKMLETFQEVGRETLLEGKIYKDLDASLRQWLLENHKAMETDEETIHYGAQAEPELRQDDEKYAEMAADSLKEETPIMTTKNQATRKQPTAEEIEIAEMDDLTGAQKRSKRGKKSLQDRSTQ